MKKLFKRGLLGLAALMIGWFLITLWAEKKGHAAIEEQGANDAAKKVLIIYDPDPFYNLDEQVCTTFATAFVKQGWRATVATVRSAGALTKNNYDLYVLCANTYNYYPDWAVAGFIKKHIDKKMKVVAITLGAGSTSNSKKQLERMIEKKQATLLGSRAFWLWRPNDESRQNESNVQVAKDMALNWANQLAIAAK